MLRVLANLTFRNLFLAQVISLLGTGLATVALGLLAFDIGGSNAGAVLGTALAIKMIAYIGIAPIAGALADKMPRKAMLVTLDLVRAAVAICLPFVNEVWQVYVLIFALQSASAAFTPTFQATIPEILPEDAQYTSALSLSRLAYEMENLASPILAAVLLTLFDFHWLFSGTAIGFLASAAYIVRSRLPEAASARNGGKGACERITRGVRIYLGTPRLRGLLAVTLAAAAGSAMVIVNTVVIVHGLRLDENYVALTLAAFGGGSMCGALALPQILKRVDDRPIMIGAAATLAAVLALLAALTALVPPGPEYWYILLAAWLILGIAYSMSMTPSGRLLRRSATSEDLPLLFAAQFALSHVCWLIAYPLVGQLGARAGMTMAFTGMAVMAAIGAIGGWLLWPAREMAASNAGQRRQMGISCEDHTQKGTIG